MANSRGIKTHQTEISKKLKNLFALVTLGMLFPSICAGNELLRRLQLLRLNYSHAPTVHFKASSIISIGEEGIGEKQTGLVSYEYWGEGGKYRVNYSSKARDSGKMFRDHSIAYNGERFQNFDIIASEFNFRAKDISYTPEVSPNLMLYPVRFLSPGWRKQGAHLRFKDLSDDKLWDYVYSSAKPISNKDTTGGLAFELPGGYMQGLEFTCHVFLGSDPDYMPVKIVRFSNDRSMVMTLEINDYHTVQIDGKKTYWPKSVRSQIIERGEVVLREETTLQKLALGDDLPPGIFNLDFSMADVVQDDDSRTTLRTPSMFQPSLDDDVPTSHIHVSSTSEQAGDSSIASKHPNRAVSDAEVNNGQMLMTHSSPRGNQRPYLIWLSVAFIVIGLTGAYFTVRRRGTM